MSLSSLILKIIYRFVVGVIALSAGLAFVAVFLVFTRGTAVLHDRDFIAPAEIYLFLIPFFSAIFVIPSTIREHRERKGEVKHEVKTAFWEPPD